MSAVEARIFLFTERPLKILQVSAIYNPNSSKKKRIRIHVLIRNILGGFLQESESDPNIGRITNPNSNNSQTCSWLNSDHFHPSPPT